MHSVLLELHILLVLISQMTSYLNAGRNELGSIRQESRNSQYIGSRSSHSGSLEQTPSQYTNATKWMKCLPWHLECMEFESDISWTKWSNAAIKRHCRGNCVELKFKVASVEYCSEKN